MRLLSESYNEKTGSYIVKLLVERDSDIYECYNLITVGDQLTTTTTRNVVHESSSGATKKTRQNLLITIDVERVEFDAEQCSLRILGRNTRESEKIRVGAFHSVDVNVDTIFTLTKENYDKSSSMDEYMQDITARVPKDHVVILPMQEGVANICVVSADATMTIGHITRNIPKKKDFENRRDKSIIKFFNDIYFPLNRQLAKFEYRTVVIVGSPGFLSDEFRKHCLATAINLDDRLMITCVNQRFITCHTSSGHRGAVDEILNDPMIRSSITNMKVFGQVSILTKFNDTLREDEDRVCYGLLEVEHCFLMEAIQELLITDTLYNANDPIKRNKMKYIIDGVKILGGQVHKFSSRHTSGEELNHYTGIAAILRFPVPNLYDLVRPESTSTTAAGDHHAGRVGKYETKTKEEEAVDAFAKSLAESDARMQGKEVEEYDEFDQWDELDEVDLVDSI